MAEHHKLLSEVFFLWETMRGKFACNGRNWLSVSSVCVQNLHLSIREGSDSFVFTNMLIVYLGNHAIFPWY